VQVLTPSQAPRGVYVLVPVHDADPHAVFMGVIRQPLLPLHVPSSPQTGPGAQSLSGSWPAGMGAQCPFAWPVFALLHALHVASHKPSQQKPSTQWPFVHSFIIVQVLPSAFFALHMPDRQ
jgi:hypothetical protein